MKVVFECYQCKWSTVVSTDALGDTAMDHLQEEPEHSVSVRRVNNEITDLPRQIDAIQNRLNEHVVQTNGIYFRLERLERAQFDFAQEDQMLPPPRT